MAKSPIHSGEILGDELEEIGSSAAELARRIHVPANSVSQIIAGKTLLDMGFADVSNLAGGMKAWVAGGGPTE